MIPVEGTREGATDETPADSAEPSAASEPVAQSGIRELLSSRGLTTAVIIDDGYDAIPHATDLSADKEAWDVFFDDLDENDRTSLAPAYAAAGAEEGAPREFLRTSNEFVAAVWNLRGTLRAELWEPLFEQYESDTARDLVDLKALEEGLQALGVKVISSGRAVPESARTAPLIFVDLFLGTGQDTNAVSVSVTKVRELLAGREAAPPIVVLMSRSSRLASHKVAFRDKAGLLGAMFRVSAKDDLRNATSLARTLERLALRRDDGHRVAAFLEAWNVSLTTARDRFLGLIRRLDLSDYAQIRDLLLSFEGQPLGSYLLDVFDLVLQHEIESDLGTIVAAEALRNVDTTSYPTPYVTGSPDLQDLVFRSLYQHPHRAQVTNTECGTPVAFGDVLVAQTTLAAWPPPVRVKGSNGEAKPRTREDALVVLTPACDLARATGTSRVLAMTGELNELTPPSWSYKNQGARTPVLYITPAAAVSTGADQVTRPTVEPARTWVQWDLKNLRTFSVDEVRAMLGSGGSHVWVARLREAHALELQQQMLADLGRVGQVARMPGTFAVRVEAYRLNDNGDLDRLIAPALESEGGVLFVGRNDEGDVHRLVLGEEACDALLNAVSALEPGEVHSKVRPALPLLRGADMVAMLERGLPVPPVARDEPVPIRVQGTTGPTSQPVAIAAVYRPKSSAVPTPTNLKNCGPLILVVREEPATDESKSPKSEVTAGVTASH